MEHIDGDEVDAEDGHTPTTGHSIVVSIFLAMLGLGVIVFAIVDATDDSHDGFVTVDAVVTEVDSGFKYNPNRKKDELVFYPSVRFVDPGSGDEFTIKMNDDSNVRVGSTVDVHLRPGSPRSATLRGDTTPVKTAAIVLLGVFLIGLGAVTARSDRPVSG